MGNERNRIKNMKKMNVIIAVVTVISLLVGGVAGWLLSSQTGVDAGN